MEIEQLNTLKRRKEQDVTGKINPYITMKDLRRIQEEQKNTITVKVPRIEKEACKSIIPHKAYQTLK
jgi:hypothetical protein